SPSAARMTFLFCGGLGFGPFRDAFVKVSRDPAAGLAALEKVTGVPLKGLSIQQAWQALVNAGALTTSNGITTTAALYALSFTPIPNLPLPINDARISFAGEYRGSPTKFVAGQPIFGPESGRFQGVGLNGSTAIVSIGPEAWRAACTATSGTLVAYAKVV